jgi:hypothetical protein
MRYQLAATMLVIMFAVTTRTVAADSKATIGLYVAPTSEWPAETISALSQALGRSGEVVRLNARTSDGLLSPEEYWLVVVADARRVSAELPESLAAYSRNGGNLALLGGPFFDEPLWEYGDRMLDREELVEAVTREVKPTVLFDFDAAELPPWRNHSDRRSGESTAIRADGGAAGTDGALRLRASGEAGWDTFQSPSLEASPDPQAVLATFWAKGDGPQSQVVVEWRERDGSRWMTTIRLSDEWQQHVLPVEAFRYWPDARVRGRGGKGDVLHPENVETITLGLAKSHAVFAGLEGHRTIWVDEIGFARPPELLARPADLLRNHVAMPVIETASPSYKLFEVTNARSLRTNPAQSIAGQIDLPEVSKVFAPIARPDGTGLDRGRPWRFVSLIESLDENGRPQTSPASLLIPSDISSGMVLSIPIADPAFFADAAVIDWIERVVERMSCGVFLLEGGAKYYVASEGEEIPVGAVVVNRGHKQETVRVEVALGDPAGQVSMLRSFSVCTDPGEERRVAELWKVPRGKGDRFQVVVRAIRFQTEIDKIGHALRIWQPKESPKFLTAREGDFYLEDQRWFAHGVNYMPSSGVACEDRETFEYWMDGRAYGQEIIGRDLRNLKAIGLNSVSAFVYYRSHADRNLLDFLMQCEEHGLKVNLSLRPGTPMDFRWEEMREIIVANRLAENDTIIAYDLAWEPMWGTRVQRRRFDPPWREWIDRTYGNIEKAEAAWEFTAPREQDPVVGPSDAQIVRDGAWRKMVLDYRRFQNELLSSAYGRARELVRSVDENHLVSFRMTIAGDPTTQPARMAYDPAGLTKAVDIMEPEGYGRIGNWDQVRPGWFTTAYCRAVAPDLPVMWAEFGYSVWDPSSGGASPDRLDFAEQFYDDFLRMAYESGSNGTFCWYSCGGYRVNEKSDYGILGPDGAWRPHTEVLHRWAERMTAPRTRKPVDRWIPIELGRDVDGVAGIYGRVGEQFWRTIDEGLTPGLRVEPREDVE